MRFVHELCRLLRHFACIHNRNDSIDTLAFATRNGLKCVPAKRRVGTFCDFSIAYPDSRRCCRLSSIWTPMLYGCLVYGRMYTCIYASPSFHEQLTMRRHLFLFSRPFRSLWEEQHLTAYHAQRQKRCIVTCPGGTWRMDFITNRGWVHS